MLSQDMTDTSKNKLQIYYNMLCDFSYPTQYYLM